MMFSRVITKNDALGNLRAAVRTTSVKYPTSGALRLESLCSSKTAILAGAASAPPAQQTVIAMNAHLNPFTPLPPPLLCVAN